MAVMLMTKSAAQSSLKRVKATGVKGALKGLNPTGG
jgi:hypothetical protein